MSSKIPAVEENFCGGSHNLVAGILYSIVGVPDRFVILLKWPEGFRY